tara:strand:- start:219 stop:461 length:243 start_codon:yes stop_codon:yes gene_type:complete
MSNKKKVLFTSEERKKDQETDGGYLWSLKTNKDGGKNVRYNNLTYCREADLIFYKASIIYRIQLSRINRYLNSCAEIYDE